MSGEILLVLRILLAIALYTFLGWAFYLLWRDLRSQQALLTERRIPMLRLTSQVDGVIQQRDFKNPEISLGRDLNCDFPLPNDTVSARHARLSYHHNQWWIEDLNSTNGTFINSEPLYTATVVVSGDEIRCGQVSLSVTFD